MGRPHSLAVLHDSDGFGGHEKAFLTWLPALLAAPELERLDFWIAERNSLFAAALAPYVGAKLRVIPHPFVKRPLESLGAYARLRYRRQVRAFVGAQPYGAVLLLQGRIENLATPMTWLDRKAPIISYVPMAHSAREMGKGGFVGSVADASKRRLYRRPDRWIVPADAVKAQLRRAGATAPVHVVENVLPLGSNPAARPTAAHGRRPVALFMGRFDAAQKGLDRLVRDLRAEAPQLRAWTFVFVGAGPYEPVLQGLAEQTDLDVQVHGWTDDPGVYLARADVLLMPSRFEGVPLAMLEALHAGLPILASDIDVFREYLPTSALHDFSSPGGFAKALADLAAPEAREAFGTHGAAVITRLNLERSQAAFVSALLGDLDRLGGGEGA